MRRWIDVRGRRRVGALGRREPGYGEVCVGGMNDDDG